MEERQSHLTDLLLRRMIQADVWATRRHDLDFEMPTLYATQLMTVAFGMGPKASALNKNLVDPRPVLKEKGLVA